MHKSMVIGVDVGGTKIAVGRVVGNKIVASLKVPTHSERGSAALIRLLTETIDKVRAPGVSGIGIGMAGQVDYEKGVFLGGPNLQRHFARIPVASLLRKRFRVPVRVDNDARCFTLAEAKLGAGRGHRSVVGLTLGTGIGGGLVLDGQPYRGRNNGAGEFGHATIALGSNYRCGCGSPGHFESLASGSAMSRLYASFGGQRVSSIEIERYAKAGDARAKKVFKTMAEGLACGLANIVLTANPDIVVVGGGLAEVDLLWKPALRACRSKIIYPAMRTTPIVRSALAGEAGILGAALLLRDS